MGIIAYVKELFYFGSIFPISSDFFSLILIRPLRSDVPLYKAL